MCYLQNVEKTNRWLATVFYFQALKLNNEVILDRQVKLDFARPRGAYTRGEGNKRNNECSMEKSNANQSGGTTVYVRGFDSTHGFDNV